jgi:hypothetical protein
MAMGLAAAVAIAAPAVARAAELDCADLHAQITKSGEVPQFTIDPSTSTVKVETTAGSCRESIEEWSAREWPAAPRRRAKSSSAAPAKKTRPRPGETLTTTPFQPDRPHQDKAEDVAKPKPILPEPPAAAPVEPFQTHPDMATEKPPAPLAEPRAEAPPAAPSAAPSATRPPPRGCNPVTTVWHAGEYQFHGRAYRLKRVFTIDKNGDTVVDNVGFLLVSPGGQQLDLRYNAVPGGMSARDVAGLALVSEAVIPTLCFATVDFDALAATANQEKPAPLFQEPDLAAEYADLQSGKTPPGGGVVEPPKTSNTFGIVIAAASGVFGTVVVLGLAAFFTRRKWRPLLAGRKGEDGEDDDEDEDVGRPRTSSRLDDDDDDEGDEGGKKKSGRGGGLKWLKWPFGKKKPANEDSADDEGDLAA